MLKNIILKDNIPKIYEIRMIESDFNKSQQAREVKNQIPTYEEFLKNYQQGQVNYEDLTHEDMGSSKGYGPCSWSNFRCSCRYGERWENLKIPCLEGCNDEVLIDFSHSICGGNFEISNKARIQCKGCGVVDNLTNFRFSCSSHSCRNNYMSVKQTDHNLFVRALLVSKRNNEIGESFFLELLQYLERS